MYNRFFKFLCFIVTMPLMFWSCDEPEHSSEMMEKYGMNGNVESVHHGSAFSNDDKTASENTDLPGLIILPEFYDDCAFYGGKLYFASIDGVSACGLTETEAVMESFADGDANCVDASSEGVFVLEDTRLVQYGFDGAFMTEYPLGAEYNSVRGVLCGDHYVFASRVMVNEQYTHKIFSLTLTDGAITEITSYITTADDITVTDLQYGGGDLVTVYNAEIMGKREYRAVRTNLNTMESSEALNLGNITALDYDSTAETLHYVTGTASTDITAVSTYCFDRDRDEETAVRLVTKRRDWSYFPEGMPEEMKKSMGVTFQSVFYTGESYILWAMTDKSVYIADASPERVVTVLAPESTGPDSAVKLAGNADIITHLLEDYDCQLRFKTYPEEEYASRLTTKLMAGDKDFDIFILSGASIHSVIANNAFLPLDGYEDVMEALAKFPRFMQRIMKTSAGTFGIPLNISPVRIMNLQAEEFFTENGLTSVSGTPDLEEYLRFTEEMRSLDPEKNLRAGYFSETFLNDFAQIYVDTGEINMEQLTGLFAQFTLDSRGVFYDHETENYSEITFLTDWADDPGECIDWGLMPTVDGTDYIGYESYACINPAAKEAENAAAYLACLADDRVRGGIPDSEWTKDELYDGVDVKLCTVLSPSIMSDSRWYELRERLWNGEIIPAAAAEEFVKIVRYYYME